MSSNGSASKKELRCRRDLKSSRLVIVKIGSSSLSGDSGFIDDRKIDSLCSELVHMKSQGIDVVLVSSGAIRAGKAVMQNHAGDVEVKGLQALAAIGQVVLMEAYRGTMASKGYKVAQILLTWDDFRQKRRLRNLLNTLNTLLSLSVVPIINENDTIAVDEIKVGDNDTLSAFVAKFMQADLLVLLSDIDGLYTGDPATPCSTLLHCVDAVTPEVEKFACERHNGTGGMDTKLRAARLATEAGIPMIIANSAQEKPLERLLKGERIGTIFLPRDLDEQ
jgi:glutamate 5-kinase